jgi:hypothetical protein
MRVLRVLVLGCLALWLTGCTAQVRVDWTTESEVNTAGFNLYRGESPDGPFDLKVNETLIPASPDPLLGGEYRYVDKSAHPGVTYYYQLQEVEKSGGVNVFGPVTARASGLSAWHVIVLGFLGGLVVFLWVRTGRHPATPA